MILLAAVLIFLGAFLLMWWAFGPDDDWQIEDQDEYEITHFYRVKR